MSSEEVYNELHQTWESEQKELKKKMIRVDTEQWQRDLSGLRYVAGVDVSFVKTSETLACASLVVCDFPDLKVMYSDCKLVTLDTPYIPGFLAFREAGFFIDLLHKLRGINSDLMPQVILVDGNGILHPRGFGIASHLGVLSDIPCVGVAKTLMQLDGIAKDEHFAAKVAELSQGGDAFPLVAASGDILGMALRGCDKSSNPIFVSAGHRICLQTAVQLAIRCCRYRIAEPVRQADIRSREFLRDKFPDAQANSKQPKTPIRKAGDNKRNTNREGPGQSYAIGNRMAGAIKGTAVCFLDEDSDEEMSFESLFGST